MEFLQVAAAFDEMERTTKRLEITEKLARLFGKAKGKEAKQLTYLCQGELVPAFQGIRLGIGDRLAEQAISIVSGRPVKEVGKKYKEKGDLGLVAQEMVSNKTQKSLESRPLTLDKV